MFDVFSNILAINVLVPLLYLYFIILLGATITILQYKTQLVFFDRVYLLLYTSILNASLAYNSAM